MFDINFLILKPSCVQQSIFEDFYASCAILGGTVCWVATMFGGAGTAPVVWSLVTVVTRLAAVLFDRELPTVQALGLRTD